MKIIINLKIIIYLLILIPLIFFNWLYGPDIMPNALSEAILDSENPLMKFTLSFLDSFGYRNDFSLGWRSVARVFKMITLFINISLIFLITRLKSLEQMMILMIFFILILVSIIFVIITLFTGNTSFHEQSTRIFQIITSPFCTLLLFPFISFIKQITKSSS